MNDRDKDLPPPYDLDNLMRMEIVSDGKANDVRIFTPVVLLPDGSMAPDPSGERKVRYFSLATIALTVHPSMPPQQVPVNFEVIASSLKEALEKLPRAAKEAAEKRMEEIRSEQVKAQIIAGAQGAPGRRVQ